MHFTQYHLAPALLNPASTGGMANWDTRIGLLYRDQWRSVPVTYQTAHFFYDRKLQQPLLPKGDLRVGGHFTHDRAGDSQLSWSQIGVNVAYEYPLNREHHLRIGLGMQAGQRAFNVEQLQFGDQYNGEVFDPGQLSAEQLSTQSNGFASFQSGVSWFYLANGTRTVAEVGAAIFHLNQPTISFVDGPGVVLPARIAAHSDIIVEFQDDWDWTAYVHWLQQGPYAEYLARGGLRYHTSYQEEPLIIGAGLGYRLGDAWIPQIEVWYQAWRLSLVYDINISSFQTATLGRGGPELALHYYLKQARPPDEFKSCPLF